MDLFLITEEEKNSLSSDIIIEPITFETYDDILSRLYNVNYDRIVITKRYVEAVGDVKVYNALKALMTISYRFASAIFLLNHRQDTIDKSIVRYCELGLKVINLDVKVMNYSEYSSLQKLPRVDVTNFMDELVASEVLDIVREIKNISSHNLEEYVAMNYRRIITTILNCEQAIEQHTQLKEDISRLSNEIIQLKEAVKHFRDKYNFEKHRTSELQHVNDKARDMFIQYAEAIKAYNTTVLKTDLGDEFMYADMQRKTLVIYMKEMEDIGFFKLFNVLFDTLSSTYNLRTKAIVLENNSRRYFNPYKDYKVLTREPKMNELVLNDKLVKHGNARKILEILTRPHLQVEVLMVYDRSYNTDICLHLPEQYTFFIGNKREYYGGLGKDIPDENFISPFEGAYTDMSFLYRDTDNLQDISLRIYCNNNYFFKNISELCLDYTK